MKQFFLLSFIPAIAYWYLESNYSLTIALLGGMGLSALELLLEWIFTKHLHPLSKFNFLLMIILGLISLLGDQGIWFKLQPSLSSLAMGSFMAFKLLRGKGLLQEMIESMPSDKQRLHPVIVRQLEIHLVLFMACYALLMAVVAISFSTDLWIFCKTGGLYILFFFFFLFEIIYIRIVVRKLHQNWLRQTVLASTNVYHNKQRDYGSGPQTQEKN